MVVRWISFEATLARSEPAKWFLSCCWCRLWMGRAKMNERVFLGFVFTHVHIWFLRGRAQVCSGAPRRGHWVPWRSSYKWLWAARHGWWALDLDLLQVHRMLLTCETSLHPEVFITVIILSGNQEEDVNRKCDTQGTVTSWILWAWGYVSACSYTEGNAGSVKAFRLIFVEDYVEAKSQNWNQLTACFGLSAGESRMSLRILGWGFLQHA